MAWVRGEGDGFTSLKSPPDRPQLTMFEEEWLRPQRSPPFWHSLQLTVHEQLYGVGQC